LLPQSSTLHRVARQEKLPLSPGASAGASTVLEGVLDRITFVNETNAWSVVKLSVAGRREPVTVVGNILGAEPGESLRLRGTWVADRRYGEQFKVSSYATIAPATVAGMKKYLGSGLVPGIGRVMAERLVASFGIDTLDVIDSEPERLLEVDGIGPVRSEQIRCAWKAQRDIRQVMVFLQSHGVSAAHAARIYKLYGDRAISVVKDDPYRLAADVPGIGFKTADQIAGSLGLLPTSPKRARAGVLHVLETMSEEGHTGCPTSVLSESATSLLAIDRAAVETALEDLIRDGAIVAEPFGEGPERAAFLQALYAAETLVATLLKRLGSWPMKPMKLDAARAIAWFESEEGIVIAEAQREAVRRALASKVLVVTGGPGTGKTTLINGIIRILDKKKRTVLLAAPTGRAAKRMSEATGKEAKTIHRLLEWSPKRMAFQRNEDNRLDADVVVLDEVSMIDTLLASHLLKAMDPASQLVLVGDVDQLPSVGPGNVLLDVIRSGSVPVVRLDHVFRQAGRSLIVDNAHRVNHGQMPRPAPAGSAADFFFIEKDDPSEIVQTIEALIKERIPRKFSLDPVCDIQVLTPMHKGMLGAFALNSHLQAMLNPTGTAVARGTRLFRVGDKVMQTRNNYDLDVYNGDIGRILAIDPDKRTVEIEYDGRPVVYEEANLDDIVCAYACSIHKSQGSEYPCVIIPVHTQHYVMLKRNLLYTAITRGRRLVVIVGSRRALSLAVNNAQTETRFTGLAGRLRA
jgi:exodeoxyribonuclease V alpha subunit